MNVTTIVLINGLWLTALSWELWVKHFTGKGYSVLARNWPGMEEDIGQVRHDPSATANLGLTNIVDHYEQIVREVETPPIIIGHGVGGLVTQILLDRGWGAAGIAIASAPPKGVSRSLGATFGLGFKASSLNAQRFHREFTNTLTEAESLSAFDRYVVPASRRVLRQVAFANFTSDTATSVNFRNNTRAPLLLVTGAQDRVAPSSLIKRNFEQYRESKAESDYKEFPDQSNFTPLRETKVADYVLGWALCRANGSKLTAAPDQTDSWSVQLST